MEQQRPPGHVPQPASSFVGRVREVRQVADLLSHYRVVSLVGPGGAGKTRLALEVSRRHRDRYPGGTWFVELAPLTTPESVGLRVAEAILGVKAGVREAQPTVLAERIGAQPALLVLDNCEHLVDSAAGVASELASRAPSLRILATSRESLHIAGEATFQLPALPPDESLLLFIDRAKARVPGFLPLDEARRVVEEICAQLEGLPLAIELAAARVQLLSPAQLLPLLSDRFALLSDGARDAPARHQTLRAAIDWSFGLLDPAEQQLFTRLAVFPGGFDLSAAASVAGPDVLGALAGLVDKSIVQRAGPDEQNPRYRMLETLREYGLTQLRSAGDLDAAKAAMLWHYVERAEATFTPGMVVGSAPQVRDLENDLDNLRAALEFSLDANPAAGLRLFGAARDVWFMRAQADGLRFGRQLLERCPNPGTTRTRALVAAGQLANPLQLHQEAIAYLEEAREQGEAAGEAAQNAWAVWSLGVAGFLGRDPVAAARWLQVSLEMFERNGDLGGVGKATASLGAVLFLRGELEPAVATLSRALSVSEAVQDEWGQGMCRTYLGLAASRGGDRAEADRQLRAALALLRPLGDITMLTFALAGLALNYGPSERRRAVRLAAAASGIRRWIGGDFAPMMTDAIAGLRGVAAEELGQAAASEEWDMGQSVGLDEAIALALHQPPGGPAPKSGSVLSRREMEVARLVADGLPNSTIAERLHLSTRTIENHVFHILGKLGLDNRTQVATWLVRSGFSS